MAGSTPRLAETVPRETVPRARPLGASGGSQAGLDLRPETHACEPRLWTQSLLKLRDIDKEGIDAESFGEVIFESFTTRLSDETQVWGCGRG